MTDRHIVTQYDWDDDAAEDDGPVREAMEESARQEHSTLRALGQCEHWVKLHADVGAETEAVVGAAEEAERYPCVFVEGFECTPLHEALSANGKVGTPPLHNNHNHNQLAHPRSTATTTSWHTPAPQQ